MRWADAPRGQRGVLLLASALLAGVVVVVATRDAPPPSVATTQSSTTLALFAGPRSDATEPSAPDTTASSTTGVVGSRAGRGPQGGRTATSPAGDRPDRPPCRNSFDPACGPLYWDPPVENTPITLRVTVEPLQPLAGEPFSITVAWSDEEAGTGFHWLEMPGACEPQEDGKCAPLGVRVPAETECRDTPHGPWATPPPAGTGGSQAFRRAYLEPGTYEWTAHVSVATSGVQERCHPDPWAEQVTQRGAITVLPARPPAQSPSTPSSTVMPSTPMPSTRTRGTSGGPP